MYLVPNYVSLVKNVKLSLLLVVRSSVLKSSYQGPASLLHLNRCEDGHQQVLVIHEVLAVAGDSVKQTSVLPRLAKDVVVSSS